MNRKRFKQQLKVDEHMTLTAYEDTRGNTTVGVGHMVQPIYVGDTISQAQCDLWLEEDIDRTIVDCKRQFPAWDSYPDEVQEILANMMFNLGAHRFREFQNLIVAVKHRNWGQAAHEMEHSLWAAQVGKRAERLIARMRVVEETP